MRKPVIYIDTEHIPQKKKKKKKKKKKCVSSDRPTSRQFFRFFFYKRVKEVLHLEVTRLISGRYDSHILSTAHTLTAGVHPHTYTCINIYTHTLHTQAAHTHTHTHTHTLHQHVMSSLIFHLCTEISWCDEAAETETSCVTFFRYNFTERHRAPSRARSELVTQQYQSSTLHFC